MARAIADRSLDAKGRPSSRSSAIPVAARTALHCNTPQAPRRYADRARARPNCSSPDECWTARRDCGYRGVLGGSLPHGMPGAWTPALPGIAAFISALVTGLFLLGGYFYTRRVERQHRHEERWTAVGVPVLNAADDLVARIFDIIVRRRRLQMQTALQVDTINVFDPPREISTVWRLLQYLAATAQLERSSFEGGGRTRLDNLRLYVSKARIALKGNVLGSPAKIQTEAQEAIGAKVLFLGRPERADPSDFYEFASRLPNDKELQDCVEYVRRIFDLPDSLDQVSPSLLTLAHFTPTSSTQFRTCARRVNGKSSACSSSLSYGPTTDRHKHRQRTCITLTTYSNVRRLFRELCVRRTRSVFCFTASAASCRPCAFRLLA